MRLKRTLVPEVFLDFSLLLIFPKAGPHLRRKHKRKHKHKKPSSEDSRDISISFLLMLMLMHIFSDDVFDISIKCSLIG